jgi:hypothetical protein
MVCSMCYRGQYRCGWGVPRTQRQELLEVGRFVTGCLFFFFFSLSPGGVCLVHA